MSIVQKLLGILKDKYHIQHWHVIVAFLTVYDILSVSFAYFFILWIRFDFRFSTIPEEYLQAFYRFVPFYTVICLVVFWFFRLYKSLWRFASFPELIRILEATAVTCVLHAAGITIFLQRMPLSYYIGGTGL